MTEVAAEIPGQRADSDATTIDATPFDAAMDSAAPDGPVTASIWPGSTMTDTSCRTGGALPYATVTPSTVSDRPVGWARPTAVGAGGAMGWNQFVTAPRRLRPQWTGQPG